MFNDDNHRDHAVAATLRSVRVHMSLLEGDDLVGFLASLGSWFGRYSAWLAKCSGFHEGRNLHLIYQRGVTLQGLQDLTPGTGLLSCLGSARDAGLPLTLNVDLAVALEQRSNLFELLACGAVNGIVLVQASEIPPEGHAPDQVAEFVREAMQHVGINFAGNFGFWQRTVLAPALCDHKVFTLCPTSQPKARRRNCLGAVCCFVSEDGAIYLCERLVGVPAARIGSIHSNDPFDPLCSPVAEQVPDWVLIGPSCGQSFSPAERAAGLMCRSHFDEMRSSVRGA
ncbi:hypothetical protein [Rhodoferax sp.]|uniref:hypothetical protein n=1 Tax=Rhodoferax sp. TaxID=50421 RepID=UPI00276FC01E|nr:hypothetical protein [Rhodoferax sp.]